MYQINYSNSFKKDIKLIKKRRYKIEKLKDIILLLEKGQSLPTKNKDHNLSNNWRGCKECHIEPDWLLIYRKHNQIVELVRTGTHSDLF